MNDDDLDARLRALPARDIAAARAHRALRPQLGFADVVRRFVAPPLLAGGVVAYLAWALVVAASAHGG